MQLLKIITTSAYFTLLSQSPFHIAIFFSFTDMNFAVDFSILVYLFQPFLLKKYALL